MKICALLLYFIALSLPLVAHGENFNYLKQIKTRYGLVVFKPDPNDESLLSDLFINGKKLAKTSGSIAKKWEIGSQDVLLVQDSSNGSSCEANFSLIIIENKVVTISEDFGNCSDLPEISRIKDTLLIKFPRMNRNNPSETEQYENGKLYGMIFSKAKGEETKKVRGELKM